MKKLETITEWQLLVYAKRGLKQTREEYAAQSKQSKERTQAVIQMYDRQLNEIENRLNELNEEEI